MLREAFKEEPLSQARVYSSIGTVMAENLLRFS
jgi:hypothetical protein